MHRRKALLAGAAMATFGGRSARAARLENPLYAGVPKEKLSGLVLGPGPAGRCDDSKTGIGIPRWDEKSGRWLMWYYARSHNFRPELPPTLGTGRIALATSDDGLNWSRFNGPLADGAVMEPSPDPNAFDTLHIGLTDVTYADGQWWMWYFGGDREEIEMPFGKFPGYRMRAGLAVSPDGINWTRRPGPAHGGALVDTGGALYSAWHNALHADGKIYLYTAVTDVKLARWDTHIFISSDGGATWAGPQPLKWTDGPAGYGGCGELTRHIISNPLRTGHRFLMAYTALDGAKSRWQRRSHALAVSDDAISWRNLYDHPIFEIDDETAWDGGGVASPQFLKVGRQWRVYYHGFPTAKFEATLPKGVGLAVSDQSEPRKLTRFNL